MCAARAFKVHCKKTDPCADRQLPDPCTDHSDPCTDHFDSHTDQSDPDKILFFTVKDIRSQFSKANLGYLEKFLRNLLKSIFALNNLKRRVAFKVVHY